MLSYFIAGSLSTLAAVLGCRAIDGRLSSGKLRSLQQELQRLSSHVTQVDAAIPAALETQAKRMVAIEQAVSQEQQGLAAQLAQISQALPSLATREETAHWITQSGQNLITQLNTVLQQRAALTPPPVVPPQPRVGHPVMAEGQDFSGIAQQLGLR